MKEVVAFMLARLGGNEKPSKEDITSILDSVGIKPDTDKLDALFADIAKLDCSVDEAIKNGMDKLAVIPAGGGMIIFDCHLNLLTHHHFHIGCDIINRRRRRSRW